MEAELTEGLWIRNGHAAGPLVKAAVRRVREANARLADAHAHRNDLTPAQIRDRVAGALGHYQERPANSGMVTAMAERIEAGQLVQLTAAEGDRIPL